MRPYRLLFAICLSLISVDPLGGQVQTPMRLIFDQGHGEQPPPRQLEPVAKNLGLEFQAVPGPMTEKGLEGVRILYLRAPSQTFTASEAQAIVQFVSLGGSLLLVLDEQERQSLEKTRVNDLISPFGMRLTPDTAYLPNTGAIAKAGEINKADREVPYDGGRAVEGGTAFAFQLDKNGKPAQPYAAYKKLENGGRIVVLAEGMASLFLGDPNGVRLSGGRNVPTTYWGKDSAIFMQEVLAWLTGVSPDAASNPRTLPLSPNNLQAHNVRTEKVSFRGRAAIRVTDAAPGGDDIDRLAVVPGTAFQDGTIEVDLVGDTAPDAPPQLRGFVGIAFRVSEDISHYECFYLRPKNGRSEDQLQRNHSVQYVSMPGFPWQKLRSETPGKYESYVDLVPGEWTHVEIQVAGSNARLYVNKSEQPVLIVSDLKQRAASGLVALWIGPGTIAHFTEPSISQRDLNQSSHSTGASAQDGHRDAAEEIQGGVYVQANSRNPAVGLSGNGHSMGTESPFVGEWKLDPTKSRMPDEMKVHSEGGNTYAFDFGVGAETIVVDGSDQPGYGGTLLSVKAEAPDTWVVQRKKDGRLLIKGTWKLSRDGSKLTDYYREFESDGSTLSMDYVYQRTGGGSGFAADWQSIKETMNSPFLIQVKQFEGDGLSFVTPSEQKTRNVKFDGKEYPNEGPNVGRGASSSIRRVDERTLVLTDKHNGKVTDTEEIGLSADLKTLTMTVHIAGRDKPNVMVFERK